MATRLEILEASLEKKKAKFNQSVEKHIGEVKQANGQPMNDKRNGAATFKKWERSNQAASNAQAEVEKTEAAIERERSKINGCERALSEMPKQIIELVDSGVLNQWRRHPNTFFVNGVDKARIQYKHGKLFCKFFRSIPNDEQSAIFRDIFNNLKRELESV